MGSDISDIIFAVIYMYYYICVNSLYRIFKHEEKTFGNVQISHPNVKVVK